MVVSWSLVDRPVSDVVSDGGSGGGRVSSRAQRARCVRAGVGVTQPSGEQHAHTTHRVTAGRDTAAESPAVGTRLAAELTGELRCVRCHYNLRGLSVRGFCPECQTPIRATLLALVDPQADEIAKLNRPHLVANAMIVWTGALAAAACSVWALRSVEFFEHFTGGNAQPPVWLHMAPTFFVLLAGLMSIAFVRPHPGMPRVNIIAAVVGVFLHGLIAAGLYRIHAQIDTIYTTPFVDPGPESLWRTAWRLSTLAAIAGAALALRPNLRALAVRSVLIRTGRVDRQSLMVMVWTIAVIAGGDVLSIVAGGMHGRMGDLATIVSFVAIGVGSLLFTVGAFGLLVDAFRLRPVLLAPGIGLTDILDADRREPPPRAPSPPSEEPST